jgi:hypothetical protein
MKRTLASGSFNVGKIGVGRADWTLALLRTTVLEYLHACKNGSLPQSLTILMLIEPRPSTTGTKYIGPRRHQ